MGKEIATQVQEAQRVPGSINPRRNMSKHIVIKLTKIKEKEKLLKATREKQQITYKGTPIRSTADFSAETLQARREWQDIFKVMKGKNLQPALLYPARISFRFDAEIKSISSKIRNKTRMSTLTTVIQHSFGSPSHGNQRRKRNKRNTNWKRSSKTVTVCR